MADAPRFRAYWERLEGRSVFTMARSDWSQLGAHMNEPVKIDVAKTPMARIAGQALVVQTVAEQRSEATAQISIIRYDPADHPTPFNKDNYTVWTPGPCACNNRDARSVPKRLI